MNSRVLVFARFFEPAYRGGGPIQTLSAMLRASPPDFTTAVVTSNADLGDPTPVVPDPDHWKDMGFARVRYLSPGLGSLRRALSGTRTEAPQLVYVNSFFDLRFSVLPQILHRLGYWPGAKFVMAPRGELHPGALIQKREKKAAYLRLYRALGMGRRVVWHASNEDEREAIRAVFPEAEVAIRENETLLPVSAEPRADRADGPLRVVFASRAVPKKGLDILLRSLASVPCPMHLQVVGAFEDPDYERQCRQLAGNTAPEVVVDFVGAATRSEVLAAMRASDVFVLPTLGENFGHVIAEALSTGCPVLCSDLTPWSATLEAGAGKVILDNDPHQWAAALIEFNDAGPQHWLEASAAAGREYGAWRTAPAAPHVFEIVCDPGEERAPAS